MLYAHFHHWIGLVVGERLPDLAVRPPLAQNQVAGGDAAQRLDTVGGMHAGLRVEALIDRYRSVVDDLEERHDPLGLAVGAFDVRPERAHRRPVVA